MTNIRRAIASAALVLGVVGGGLVATDLSTIIGSSGDAGVMTTCGLHAKTCSPGGPTP